METLNKKILASLKQVDIVDRIIGDKLGTDIDLRYRARILVNAWLIFCVALFINSFLIAIVPMKMDARIVGMALCLLIAVSLLVFLLTFRKSGNFRLYGHMSLAIALVAITVSVCLSGSPINSPSIGLFYLIPILAVFFLGKSSCWFWSLTTGTVIVLLLTLHSMNFPFPNIYDDTYLWETRLLSVLIGIIGVSGLVATYERSNRKLRKDKNTEYQRLEFLAHNDQLTRLLNRMSFEEKLEHSIAQLGLQQKNEKLALIYMDLDGFKPINDDFGHKAGDFVLSETANRIQLLLRDKGYAARHGGDEFLILLEHVQKTEEVVEFVEALLQMVAQPIVYEQVELRVTISVGVALFPKDAQDISMLMRNADSAMYQAKVNKNSFVLFQD